MNITKALQYIYADIFENKNEYDLQLQRELLKRILNTAFHALAEADINDVLEMVIDRLHINNCEDEESEHINYLKNILSEINQ